LPLPHISNADTCKNAEALIRTLTFGQTHRHAEKQAGGFGVKSWGKLPSAYAKHQKKRRKNLHLVAFDTQIYNGNGANKNLLWPKHTKSSNLQPLTKKKKKGSTNFERIQMQFKFTYLEPLGISNYLPFHANLATIFLTEIKLRQVGLRQPGVFIVGGDFPDTPSS